MSARLGFPVSALLLFLGLGAWTASAAASVARALDLEALTAQADEIVVARCEGAVSRFDDDGRIVTDLSLRVVEAMKGRDAGQGNLTLTVLGGEVGELGMRVPGAATMATGEEAIVFVTRRSDGRRRALGLSQGVLPIVREAGAAMVHPGARGLVLVRGSGPDGMQRTAGALEAPVRLEEVVAQIRSLVARGASR